MISWALIVFSVAVCTTQNSAIWIGGSHGRFHWRVCIVHISRHLRHILAQGVADGPMSNIYLNRAESGGKQYIGPLLGTLSYPSSPGAVHNAPSVSDMAKIFSDKANAEGTEDSCNPVMHHLRCALALLCVGQASSGLLSPADGGRRAM